MKLCTLLIFLLFVPVQARDWSLSVLSGQGRSNQKESVSSHLGYKIEYFQDYRLRFISLGPAASYLYSTLDYTRLPWSGSVESHVLLLGPKASFDFSPKLKSQLGVSYGLSRAHLSHEYRDPLQRHYAEAARCQGSYNIIQTELYYLLESNRSLGLGASYHRHHIHTPGQLSLGSKVQRDGGVFLQDDDPRSHEHLTRARVFHTFNIGLSFSNRF
jgi:hypothetical protein